MILIADSGSTKCSWAACSNTGELISLHTTIGFNPKYSSYTDITQALNNSTLATLKNTVTQIYFYGAGCSSEKRNSILEKPFADFFSNAKINIRHDLEAAVKASYTGEPIICSILGTGSNSCLYDGDTIFENAPSLGFILGDEGSGNYFGKQLINSYVNNTLPKHITTAFELWTTERKDDIIENIYNLQRPNLYLASFFRFMHEHKSEPFFNTVFNDGIQHFFDLHIKCFTDYKKYPLTFVGSVAYYLSDYIYAIAKKEGLIVHEIIQSPIDNLIKEHFKKK